MKLIELGFDQWFSERAKGTLPSGSKAARVTAVNKGAYLVRNEDAEVFAELCGTLLYSAASSIDYPCVGDWVAVEYENSGELAIIQAVLPRRTFLRRKAAGRKIDYQLIAANIDAACIVQALDFDFNLRRLDRYLVMIREGGIRPVVLLTKADLVSPEEAERQIAAVRQAAKDCSIMAFSNHTGEGFEPLRALFEPGKTYCLLGSSGVGKSSLVNRLIGEDRFETKTVSDYRGKGRHTTTRRELIVLEHGAMLIDTPGMREVGSIGANEGIGDNFADLEELGQSCRFSDCSHLQEAGCAVLAAIVAGELDEERYQSYLKLRRESAHYERSYVEKRRVDKKFGRMVKSALKGHPKY